MEQFSNMIHQYKETYTQELYELIVKYSQKYSELSKKPILQVIKEQTPIYFFIGNYNWNYDYNSKYSKEFEFRIKSEDIAFVAFDMQNKYYKRLTKNEDWFGCFKYKYRKSFPI